MRLAFLSTLGVCAALVTTAGCAGQGSADTNGGFGGGILTGAGGAGGETASTTGTGGSSSTTSEPAPVCAGGAQQACTCKDDLGATTESTQTCFQDGSQWGECDCPCGDNICEDTAGENCHTCKADCGACAPCEYKTCSGVSLDDNLIHAQPLDSILVNIPAPMILQRLKDRIAKAGFETRALAAALLPALPGESPSVAYLRKVIASSPGAATMIKTQLSRAGLVDLVDYRSRFPEIPPPAHVMADLPTGGTTECGAPFLKVRLASVKVIEDYDDTANDKIYCIITSEGQSSSELLVSPVTTALDEGKSQTFGVNVATMWGQAGPATPKGNLVITYDCYEQDDTAAYQSMLDSLGSASSSIGGIPGMPYGWVFGVGGAVAPVIGDVIALNGDDQLFNAQQFVKAADQLELTKGAYWNVTRGDMDSCFTCSDWQWELRVEAWGCAEYGILP